MASRCQTGTGIGGVAESARRSNPTRSKAAEPGEIWNAHDRLSRPDREWALDRGRLVARRPRIAPSRPGCDRCLGASVLAFTWCLLSVEVLGTAGFLGIRTVLIASAALFAVGLAARQLRPLARPEPSRDDTAGEPWSAEVLLALGLVAWTLAVLGMHSLLLPVKVVSDGPIYHLYFAARWWKAGRLFLVAAPFGENAATYFPANGDVWFTWLMVSWGGDRLAKVGQAPFLFLAAAAVFRDGDGRSGPAGIRRSSRPAGSSHPPRSSSSPSSPTSTPSLSPST